MRKLQQGDRVVRTETGQVGTVRVQFIDGYVSLDLDDGHSAELDRASLTELAPESPKDQPGPSS